jgi:hypothetical protein
MEIEIYIDNHAGEPGPMPVDRVARLLREMEARIVGKFEDIAAELEASVDAAIVRGMQDVSDAEAEVVRLQAIIDSGEATPAQVERFAAIKAKLDKFDPRTPSVIPPEEIPPGPGPTPTP